MTTDPTRDSRRAITLGPAAHELRRFVGPSGWVVLEEMMQHATGEGDGVLMADVSIRSLAASCGLAKDTVHRAVRRLREVGVVEPVQERSSSGTFASGGYRLAVPVVCISVAARPSAEPRSRQPSEARRSSSSQRRSPAQLALAFEG